MKRILYFSMVCLIICLAACSDDEPKQQTESIVENAAKHLNGRFTCKSVIAGNSVTESFEFTPFSEPKTIGTSKVYGTLRYINTQKPGNNASSYLYTFTYNYEKLYLNLLNDEGSISISYIISDVTSNSFHLRIIGMEDDQYQVFIRE